MNSNNKNLTNSIKKTNRLPNDYNDISFDNLEK